MKGIMDHCDDRDHGALLRQERRSTVMTRAMDHGDDRGQGAL